MNWNKCGYFQVLLINRIAVLKEGVALIVLKRIRVLIAETINRHFHMKLI